MSFTVGLTGPTGAGKSLVSLVAAELGFYTVDCDKVARRAAQEPSVLSAIMLRFGAQTVKDGCLDRAALADAAFLSPENTDALNKIILPTIVGMIREETSEKSLVLLDAPTLFESGIDADCDVTVCVLAGQDSRRERIIVRDGLDNAAADRRLSAAKPDEFFKARCDIVIENNGSLDELKQKAKKILECILEENKNGNSKRT